MGDVADQCFDSEMEDEATLWMVRQSIEQRCRATGHVPRLVINEEHGVIYCDICGASADLLG